MFKFFNLFSFTARFSKIKKTFTKTIAQAEKLNAMMEEANSEKTKQIEKLQVEITENTDLQAKTQNFITNLTKLVE